MPTLKDTKKEVVEEQNPAIKKFRDKGFNPKQAPNYGEPKMPKEITVLTVGNLGNLMSNYAAWREYTDDMVAEATARVVAAQEEFDFKYAVKFMNIPGDKVTQKKMQLEADPELRKLRQELTEAEMYRDLLSAKQDSFNNAIATISREITRRGQQFPDKFNQ